MSRFFTRSKEWHCFKVVTSTAPKCAVSCTFQILVLPSRKKIEKNARKAKERKKMTLARVSAVCDFFK